MESSPCQRLASFWRTRKKLHESSKVFVEHTLHVARIQFWTQVQEPCTWYSKLSYDRWFIDKRMLALERPVWREKTRLTSSDVRVAATSKAWRDSWEQSLLFSSSIKKTLWDILWIPTWDTGQKKAKGQEVLLTGCRIFISGGSREGARGTRPLPPYF